MNFQRVIATVLLLMLFFVQSAAAQTPNLVCNAFTDSPTAERITYYMGEGSGFIVARQYASAVRSFSCIIEQLDSSYTGAYTQRAVAYTMQQSYELAIDDYNTALEQDSSLKGALNNRGVVLAALQNYEDATADFTRLIEIDSEYVRAYMNRGVIRAIQGDFENAIADLEQAIDLSNIDEVVTELRDPERPSGAPTPAYNRSHAQMYAILGIIYSGFALENYNDYLLLRGGSGDQRVQSAAGALESRFNFELRLDDGTWLLSAEFTPSGEEVGN